VASRSDSRRPSGCTTTAAGRRSTAPVSFQSPGHIAKWDGTDWTAVGGSFDSSSTLYGLVSFDSGERPRAVRRRTFSSADGLPVLNVARWNGAHWSTLGTGLNDDVLALLECDDGSGRALYAGGDFTSAGGAAINRIARVGRRGLVGARQRDETAPSFPWRASTTAVARRSTQPAGSARPGALRRIGSRSGTAPAGPRSATARRVERAESSPPSRPSTTARGKRSTPAGVSRAPAALPRRSDRALEWSELVIPSAAGRTAT
jgi:hypothetical protein